MTLTELRYIVAVARERHFGRAAAACFVSQPTLSVGVKKLEEELGVTLFERSKTDISLTPAGTRIVEQAQRVLEESATIRQLAQGAQDQLSGLLRLGAIYTIGPYLIPNADPPAPRTAAADATDDRGELHCPPALKNSNAASSTPFSSPCPSTSLASTPCPCTRNPSWWCCPPPTRGVNAQQIAADALAEENLLMLGAGHCFRDQVLAACPGCAQPKALDDGLQPSVEGGSLETIRHMVASGMGITVLPCTAAGTAQYAQRLLAIRRFKPPAPSRTVALAWRASFPRPQAMQALAQAIRDCGLSCVETVEEIDSKKLS